MAGLLEQTTVAGLHLLFLPKLAGADVTDSRAEQLANRRAPQLCRGEFVVAPE